VIGTEKAEGSSWEGKKSLPVIKLFNNLCTGKRQVSALSSWKVPPLPPIKEKLLLAKKASTGRKGGKALINKLLQEVPIEKNLLEKARNPPAAVHPDATPVDCQKRRGESHLRLLALKS